MAFIQMFLINQQIPEDIVNVYEDYVYGESKIQGDSLDSNLKHSF